MSAVGKRWPLLEGTLAVLESLGTQDGLQVGQKGVATDYDEDQMLQCLTVTDGSSTWGYKRRFVMEGTLATGSAAERWFPVGSAQNAATALTPAVNNVAHVRPLAYDTEVLTVKLKQDSDPGSTTVKLYKDAAGAAVASVTDTPSGAAVWHEYALTHSYSAGDAISLSIDPANVPTAIVQALIFCEETVPVAA